MPIRLLPDQLASQIAAGEVVERPVSVVKELVENALDAGATHIDIEIEAGGRQLMRISDDGSGIPAAEAATAFQRHATSKLVSIEDLNAIGTLGFRGEALAAIAAVSRVTLVTRTPEERQGTQLVLHGGGVVSRAAVGAPAGTVISVTDLFYNVPARLKFLKSMNAEKRQIDEFVTRYALAYPQVRFSLSHNGRTTFQSSGNGSLVDTLVAIYGPDTARQLLEIDPPDGTHMPATADEQAPRIVVRGFAGPPSLHWSSRAHIVLFVNGRWIRDNQLTYAVIQAYHTLLPTGRYPLAVLFISVPLNLVDVNVHPAKTEIRFRQGVSAFGTVQRAVRAALLGSAPVRSAGTFEQLVNPGWEGALDSRAFRRRDEPGWQSPLGWERDAVPDVDLPASSTAPVAEQEPPLATPRPFSDELGGDRLPIMRVVGQVGASYIIAEGPEGLFLVDQHAAHERVLYEQFLAAWDGSGLTRQGLVTGVALHLPPAQASLLAESLHIFARLGFDIEPFGPNAFMVRTVPAMLSKINPERAVRDVVEDLERGDRPLQSRVEDRVLRRVCKSAAVKAGQTLSRSEMEALIRQLEACESPHTCPHGRPTLIHISVAQLARQFGRM